MPFMTCFCCPPSFSDLSAVLTTAPQSSHCADYLLSVSPCSWVYFLPSTFLLNSPMASPQPGHRLAPSSSAALPPALSFSSGSSALEVSITACFICLLQLHLCPACSCHLPSQALFFLLALQPHQHASQPSPPPVQITSLVTSPVACWHLPGCGGSHSPLSKLR